MLAVPVAALAVFAAGCAIPRALPTLRAPLARDRTVEAIATEFDIFVPTELGARGIPGVAIALVRGGEVVWAAGYGTADRTSGRPVHADTLFEVASNSKAVAAYVALALAAEGRLDLDAPLERALGEPFLDPSPWRDAVTARRVLSHTSGMSNFLTGLVVDRTVHFEPGTRFSYSGHGYTLLERAIEATTDERFAAHAERLVLRPLEMRSSGYVLGPELAARVARPHFPGSLLAGLAAAAWLALAGPVRWLVRRPAYRALVRGAGAALALVGAALFGRHDPALAGFVVALAVALAACLELGVAGGLRLLLRPGARTPRRVAGALLGLGLLAFLATRGALPAPAHEPSCELDLIAAGGLRASAPDLARFLAELVRPRRLEPALVLEMRRPQVRVAEHLSWGLGIGLQDAEDASLPDAVWHWGFNPGFYSLMVGFPAEQSGVVVLANGGEFGALELAREIALRALGGEHRGYWNDAIQPDRRSGLDVDRAPPVTGAARAPARPRRRAAPRAAVVTDAKFTALSKVQCGFRLARSNSSSGRLSASSASPSRCLH